MFVVALVAVVAAVSGVSDTAFRSRPGTLVADVGESVPAPLVVTAAQARSLYLEGDFKGAIAATLELEAAFVGPETCTDADCMHAGPAFLDDDGAFDAWADAMTTRGLALQRTHDPAGMDEAFRTIIAARPAWQPDRGFVPPKQLQRFEELRLQLLSTELMPLQVKVKGTGEVRIDGRTVSPGVPVDVVPGRHFVGVSGRGRVVVVSEPTTMTLPGLLPSTTPPASTTASEEGVPWGFVVGGAAAAVVVVIGVVVGVVVALDRPAAPENPGGVTVLVDASRLNGSAP